MPQSENFQQDKQKWDQTGASDPLKNINNMKSDLFPQQITN